MTRIPRLRRLFALAAVLALTVVPLASARPLERPMPQADGDFVSAALKWAEDLVGFRRPGSAERGRRQGQAQIQRKDSTQSGSCIDPVGRPRPCTE